MSRPRSECALCSAFAGFEDASEFCVCTPAPRLERPYGGQCDCPEQSRRLWYNASACEMQCRTCRRPFVGTASPAGRNGRQCAHVAGTEVRRQKQGVRLC